MAKLFCDELGRIGVDHIGDLRHLALFHHQLDHVDGALRHAVGEFLDRDRLGQDDFARELFLGLVDMALEPLGAAAEGGDRAGALLLLAGGAGDREPAAAVLLGARSAAARDNHFGRHAGTANDALGVFSSAATGRAAAGLRALPARRPEPATPQAVAARPGTLRGA